MSRKPIGSGRGKQLLIKYIKFSFITYCKIYTMIVSWLGAIAIGLSLGLLGSGGSILTVPVLVYLLGQDEKVAIAGSLAIVGSIALAGALPYLARRQVDWRSLAWFGLPGMLGTWTGAWLAAFVTGQTQLLVFAVVMLLAAGLMLRHPSAPHRSPVHRGHLEDRRRWSAGRRADGLRRRGAAAS